MKAIVLHSVVPVRAEAAEESEQLTQLLFAETCEILEQLPRWTRIRNDYDGQEGWVDFKMITALSEQEEASYAKTNKDWLVKLPMAFAVSENNGQTIPLTAGTRLPDYSEGHFTILGVRFAIDPQMVTLPIELTKENFQQVVRFFLNIPYLWGGKNAMGMDCSGFVGIVMSLFGKRLPRNAREQVHLGEEIIFLQEARCGDLVFFDHQSRSKDQTNISHVGILLDAEHVIHCSGRVKVEKIDAHGIIETLSGEHSHDLRIIKRI